MLFDQTVFIGIDPTASGTGITIAVLDRELKVLTLGEDDLSGVMAYVGGQRSAVVAVNAPRRPNQGLMEEESFRAELKPQPSPGRWTGFRAAEYLLFQKNIRIPMTAGSVEDCPRWMQTGFKIYRRLEELGFRSYPAEQARKQTLEVYPHGAFTVLLKRIPFRKNTLEGRLQRQLVLHSRALDIPDPMRVFEEITRYRILQGILPLEKLYSAEALDALVAAYTARLAVTDPGSEITLIGSPEEGEIVLPAGELKQKYS